MQANLEKANTSTMEQKGSDRLANLIRLVPGIKIEGLTPVGGIIKGTTFEVERSAFSSATNPTAFSESLLPDLTSAARHGPIFSRLNASMALFRDQILVDLGAGNTSNGFKLATIFNAKGYIGVETSHSKELAKAIEAESPTIPYEVVNEDMVHFLRRLPHESVSVLASGIDYSIIQEGGRMREIGTRIEEVLHMQGCFVNSFTQIEVHLPRIYSNGTELAQEVCIKLGAPVDSNLIIPKRLQTLIPDNNFEFAEFA